MTTVSTHVLDTARGTPAEGVRVTLQARDGQGWRALAAAVTDGDGRAPDLARTSAGPGVHRLVFATGEYLGPEAFFPEVSVVFAVDGQERLHVPLLLSPFGYSTYRGS